MGQVSFKIDPPPQTEENFKRRARVQIWFRLFLDKWLNRMIEDGLQNRFWTVLEVCDVIRMAEPVSKHDF